jgi:hypothetical protein
MAHINPKDISFHSGTRVYKCHSLYELLIDEDAFLTQSQTFEYQIFTRELVGSKVERSGENGAGEKLEDFEIF